MRGDGVSDQEAARLPDTREAWNRYGLEQIWLMVRDEDGNDSYAQVAAWYRMGRLCTDQADQLQKALDQLMIKWPPKPKSAAEKFKVMVDGFILSMRDSAAAAQANEAPLIAVTSLLSDAKDAIGQLRQRRIANEKAQQEWTDQASLPFASPPRSPLEPGWREELDHQARDIMHATDIAIGNVATDFRSPAPYKGPKPIDDGGSGNGPGQGGSGGGPGPSLSGGSGRTLLPHPTFDPPALSNSPVEAATGLSTGGPVLDGELLGLRTMGTDFGSPFISTPAGVALAPGGVIGAPTTGGSPNVASAAGDVGQARSVTTGTGSNGPLMAPPMAGRARPDPAGRGVTSGGRRRRRTDPHDPWLPTGGPSTLEPSPEPDFDPGPNVIGIDR
jgi:hypothetical protein